MATSFVIVEKNQISSTDKDRLRDAGILVIQVKDISKVIVTGTDQTEHSDDGFNLDAKSA